MLDADVLVLELAGLLFGDLQNLRAVATHIDLRDAVACHLRNARQGLVDLLIDVLGILLHLLQQCLRHALAVF